MVREAHVRGFSTLPACPLSPAPPAFCAPQLVHAVSSGERLPVPPREEVAGAPPPPAVYDGYIALMQRCWAQDPAERPPFADVIVDLRWVLRGAEWNAAVFSS